MHTGFGKTARFALSVIVVACLAVAPLAADEVSKTDAEQAVLGWLSLNDEPLGAVIGNQIAETETYVDEDQQPLFYVVYLNPNGYVIVPADDGIEPIIAFVEEGVFDPSDDNPLGALVTRDIPGRIDALRDPNVPLDVEGINAASDKWDQLTLLADVPLIDTIGDGGDFLDGLGSVTDERVAPFVESRWSQSVAYGGGPNCYNYYTPNNYVCGCVATAMSQLMRYHQHPTSGVGTGSFTIYVNGTPQSASLRGGDGSGGAYDWANMKLVPAGGVTTTECQAIGALCRDAGLTVNMQYTASSSGSDTLQAGVAFVNTFGYSNAKRAYNSGSNLGTALQQMANPNLDAGWPVILGITGSSGGHAIVCDGYGFSVGQMYHHLNMGWAGTSDAWYVLPNINSAVPFTSVYKCVYNVYVTGTGEIISGRVTDPSGSPINGASVTAARSGGGSYNATTNAKGIYALTNVPSASSYTVSVTKAGYTFSNQNVSTLTSTDFSLTTGNKWGIDFQASFASAGITSPANGSTLSGSSVTFEWSSVTGATAYTISAGSAPGGTSYFTANCGTSTSQLVTGLPVNGSTVYVTLATQVNGTWVGNAYTYTAFNGSGSTAELTDPAPGSTLTATSATLTWSAGTGVDEYVLYVGQSVGGSCYFSGSCGTNLSQAVSGLPSNGATIYVRLGSRFGAGWIYNDYTYTAMDSTTAAAVMSSPAPGGTFTSSAVTFSWTAGTGVTEYWLLVGTAPGGSRFFNGSTGLVQSQAVSNLPTDGSTVYVQLMSKIGGAWVANIYTYTALNDPGGGGGEMTSPANGATFTSSSVTFNWSAGTGVTEFWLMAGPVPGGSRYFNASCALNQTQAISGLPTDGSTVYVRLFSKIGGVWICNEYTYTALNSPSGGGADMTTPANGATFTSSSVTFNWSAGTGVTEYWLMVGPVPGGGRYFNASCGLAQSQTVSGLPTNGRAVYVRLMSKIGGAWICNTYQYTSLNDPTGGGGSISSPANGSTLAGSDVTFNWNAGTGVSEYYLLVGSSYPGSGLYFSGSCGLNLSQAVTGLPQDARTIYLRLMSKIGTAWVVNDYTYTAAGVAMHAAPSGWNTGTNGPDSEGILDLNTQGPPP